MNLTGFWDNLNFEEILPDFVKKHSRGLIKLTFACGIIYFSVPQLFRLTFNHPKVMSRRHFQDRSLKKEVFEYLQIYSKQHGEKECLRILEIGAGDGRNFEYYPYPSRLVIVDPCDKYRKDVEHKIELINTVDKIPEGEKGEQLPNLELESWLMISADDMVDDGSSQGKKHKTIERPLGHFDACVSTYSFCAVRNFETVLQNIASLVKPGGLMLTMEHSHPPGRLALFICLLCEPIFHWLTGYCHLFRRPDRPIEQMSSTWEVLFSKEFLSPERSSLNPGALTVGFVAKRR
ncbi:unnamed protein product [Calicophoron daubneyi]|uniref:Uncharacterized protein n=1 Tax=Calicophoron daubneyi TaxID=300641 RepID=A0AAV2T2A0_CALDB